MQVMREKPLFILDGGHNPKCIEAVRDSLKTMLRPDQKVVFLTGILKGKDASGMMRILREISRDFVITAPDSYRATSVEELSAIAEQYGCRTTLCPSSEEGVRKASEMAGADGAVCCVGSLYLAGEVLDLFQRETKGNINENA